MIERSKKFGIGKQIGDELYFHKDYIDKTPFSQEIEETLKNMPNTFKFTLIKINIKTKSISLLYSPCFDSQFHPALLQSMKIFPDGTTKIRNFSFNPPIYHHRWTFVEDDYKGFDVEEDKLWSYLWSKTPLLDFRRYGKSNHWNKVSLPKILHFYNAQSIEEIIRRA